MQGTFLRLVQFFFCVAPEKYPFDNDNQGGGRMERMKGEAPSIKYFLIFSCVTLIVTCCIGISYGTTVFRLEESREKMNKENISKSYEMFDDRIGQIRKLSYQMSTIPSINYMLGTSPARVFSPDDIIVIQSAMDYIRTIYTSFDQIVDIQVYAEVSGQCLGLSGIQSYDRWHLVSFDFHAEIPDLIETIKSDQRQSLMLPETTYYKNGIPALTIPFIQKLPLVGSNSFIGAIIIFIDKVKLLDAISPPSPLDSVLIQDANGAFITSWGSRVGELSATDISTHFAVDSSGIRKMKINGETQYINKLKPYGKFIFTTFSPKPTYFDSVDSIRLVFYLMLGMSIIVLSMTARKITGIMGRSIKQLVDSNSELNELIEKQKEDILASHLIRLLTGIYQGKEETPDTVFFAPHFPDNHDFRVVIIKIGTNVVRTDRENNLLHMILVKKSIRNILNSITDSYEVDIAYDTLAVIHHTPSDETIPHHEIIDRIAIRIHQEIEEEYGTTTYFSCGGSCHDIRDLNISYTEALFCLSKTGQENRPVTYFDEKTKLPIIHYPLEIEQQLMICTKTHDLRALESILDRVYEDNFTHKILTHNGYVLLISKLKTTLLSLCNELCSPEDNIYKSVLRYVSTVFVERSDAETDFTTIREFILKIAEANDVRKKLKTCFSSGKVLAFVDENCFSKLLSLTMVADTFGISESSLSTVFKEHVGVNFQTYVEGKRLEKALELMTGPDVPSINHIALEVGYANAHSFRRAFKRKFGTNPVNYMKVTNQF